MKIILANVIMVAHVLLVLLMLGSVMVAIKYKSSRPWITIVFFSLILLWQIQGACPFTPWEAGLRKSAGETTRLGEMSFIQYYLQEWFDVFVEQKILDRISYGLLGFLIILDLHWLITKKRNNNGL